MAKSLLSLLVTGIVLLVFAGSIQGDPVAERLESSPRHHEWVEVDTPDGKTIKCWVVYPEVDKPTPAVIVVHENRGLNDWARALADQVAEAGYVAVAPDLLSGKAPQGGGTAQFESSDAARTAIYELDHQQVMQNLDSAVEYAKGLDATTDKAVVAGFCWGGGKTFAYAAHNPDIAAAFVFYGTAPGEEAIKKIQSPVYGFYGGNDHRITGQVPRVAELMNEHDKTFKPVVYRGAGHGFMRAGEAEDARAEDKQARSEAWQRWKKLLGEL